MLPYQLPELADIARLVEGTILIYQAHMLPRQSFHLPIGIHALGLVHHADALLPLPKSVYYNFRPYAWLSSIADLISALATLPLLSNSYIKLQAKIW